MTDGPDLVMERFADGLDHPEGLAFTSDGTLWAGGEAGQIYRIGPDGTWTMSGETGGSCLGLAVDRDDSLYICDPGRGAVVRRRADGQMDTFLDRVQDRAIEAPNFPVFGPNGDLFVSCSGTWGRSDGWIARVDPAGRAEIFWTGLELANGLAIDQQGQYLYVAETYADRVRRKRLDAFDDSVEVVVEDLDRLPDGLAFDALGTLYITCYASDRIYARTVMGRLSVVAEDRTSIALSHPTNCAFGGPSFDALFVACYGLRHITRIALGTAGQPLYGGPRPA
jgi:gluconolactonase